MNAVELMVKEHKMIKRMLAVLRKLCIQIVDGREVNYEAFYQAIDFIRNYADKHHHSKEENILFKEMIETMDKSINREPIKGMYVEHDMGRLYIRGLEEALERVSKGDRDSRVDIIANAVSYTDMLQRHIHKEDHAVYIFAQKHLSEEVMKSVEERCEEVEEAAQKEGTQEKYVRMVDELERLVSSQ